MKRTAAMFLALGLLVTVTAPVRADAVYHTERLTLNAVADGVAGTGMVVNVHPNGPNRYAIENYQLRHADADATYQVWLNSTSVPRTAAERQPRRWRRRRSGRMAPATGPGSSY